MMGNNGFKPFIKLYKGELYKWSHDKPIPEESLELIKVEFSHLNTDDKNEIIDLVLHDLKYAYTTKNATKQDLELLYIQKEKMIGLKVFIVKFFIVALGSIMLTMASMYIISELILLASSPSDFFTNFSKYMDILLRR